jgi:hypothetical protein
MHASLDPLLALAFRTAPAAQANQAIAEARDAVGADRPSSYELLVPPEATLEAFSAQVLPKLIYHLESRGARPPGFTGVFFSLFAGETLHFVKLSDGLPLLAAAVGKSMDALYAEHGTGEVRHAINLGEATEPRPRQVQLLIGPK